MAKASSIIRPGPKKITAYIARSQAAAEELWRFEDECEARLAALPTEDQHDLMRETGARSHSAERSGLSYPGGRLLGREGARWLKPR